MGRCNVFVFLSLCLRFWKIASLGPMQYGVRCHLFFHRGAPFVALHRVINLFTPVKNKTRRETRWEHRGRGRSWIGVKTSAGHTAEPHLFAVKKNCRKHYFMGLLVVVLHAVPFYASSLYSAAVWPKHFFVLGENKLALESWTLGLIWIALSGYCCGWNQQDFPSVALQTLPTNAKVEEKKHIYIYIY